MEPVTASNFFTLSGNLPGAPPEGVSDEQNRQNEAVLG